VFRERCASCHAARLVTDRPDSAVPFADWERLVMSPAGAIVWARDTREQTGVVPYVHPEGTRVPSLRRLYRKRPYFTNGSSPDLPSVLARARMTPDGFLHDAAPGTGEPPDRGDQAGLLAFLGLLLGSPSPSITFSTRRSPTPPASVRIDSGWNCTAASGRSRCSIAITTPSALSAVTTRQAGIRSRTACSEW